MADISERQVMALAQRLLAVLDGQDLWLGLAALGVTLTRAAERIPASRPAVLQVLRQTIAEIDTENATTQSQVADLRVQLEGAERLLDGLIGRIESVVPYVTATLHASQIEHYRSQRDRDWYEIHAGRGFSSDNQLKALLREAKEARAALKGEDLSP